MTRPADVAAAVDAGADALGLVFYPSSRRYLEVDTAAALAARMPAFVSAVALFLDADHSQVDAVIRAVRPAMLQFHGHESAAFCRSFWLPYMKALGMADRPDVQAAMRDYADARALLLDSHSAGQAGGSGKRLDASLRLPEQTRPLVIAGGLTPTNVANVIGNMRPYGVDVSSGVESAPGVKSAALMQAFCAAVHAADTQLTQRGTEPVHDS